MKFCNKCVQTIEGVMIPSKRLRRTDEQREGALRDCKRCIQEWEQGRNSPTTYKILSSLCAVCASEFSKCEKCENFYSVLYLHHLSLRDKIVVCENCKSMMLGKTILIMTPALAVRVTARHLLL